MGTLDRILDRYDLATLVAAVARRRARERRLSAALERRRRKIEAELRKLDELAAAYGGGRRTEARKAGRRPNARRFNDITLAEAAARVLAPRKKPMHYKELTETIRKRGLYRSESKSLSSTVMIALTRDRRFRRVEPGVFEMKGD